MRKVPRHSANPWSVRLGPVLFILLLLAASVVSVAIGDNGPGMDPEVASKIFDPFFTTKPVGSGTGMGLDFVWRIVTNEHHGRVSVESEPGKGTTFIVELPRRAAVR